MNEPMMKMNESMMKINKPMWNEWANDESEWSKNGIFFVYRTHNEHRLRHSHIAVVFSRFRSFTWTKTLTLTMK